MSNPYTLPTETSGIKKSIPKYFKSGWIFFKEAAVGEDVPGNFSPSPHGG